MTEVTGMGIAAQWGEEEIVVYLPALQLDAGIQFAERLIQEIPAKTKPGVTVSGGMSSWTTTKPMAPLHYSNQPTKHSIQQKIRGKTSWSFINHAYYLLELGVVPFPFLL